MKNNKIKFFAFLLFFSVLLVSPILAQTTVDMDINWVGTQTAPTYYEGDVVMFNTRLVNYGADYLTGAVELSRVDGQPITTIPLGEGIDVKFIPVFENYDIQDVILSEDVHFQTKDFAYAGYTFDIPEGDYQLKGIGRGYVESQYTTDTDYLYFTLNEEQTQDENGTELINLTLNIECTDELKAGDVLNCKAIVQDQNGSFVQGANVNFNENLFGTCLTNTQGYCSIDYTLPTFLTPDTYYVTAVASKINYTNATDLESYKVVETIVPIKELTIVDYSCNTPLYFGDNLYCSFKVIDEDNNYVTDAQTSFTINGISLGNVMQNAEVYYVNYGVPVYLTGTGNYLIKAQADKFGFDGDEKYFQIELLQHELSLSLNCPNSVYINESLVCEATVRDEFNSLMSDSLVIFNLEGESQSCLTTSAGVCTVSYNIDDTFVENQNYVINATAKKTYYVDATASTNFVVLPTGVVLENLSLTLDCDNGAYIGDTVLCKATVLDEKNNFVSNSNVAFTLENDYQTCLTNNLGVCEINFNIDNTYVENRIYTIFARATKDNYNDATTQTSLTILPTTVQDKEMFLDIDCTDEIYLNDELVCNAKVTQKLTTQSILTKIYNYVFSIQPMSPVKNASVIFQIDETQHNQELVCNTNSAGICQVSKSILSIYGYQENETYKVNATAFKEGYEQAFATDSFRIISIPLSSPKAIIDGLVNAKVDEKVTFDGSNSLPGVDATITKYTWSITDINGNVILQSWSSGASLPYQFKNANTYVVKLVVLNSNNLTDSTTHNIVIVEDGNGEKDDSFSNQKGIKVNDFSIVGLSDSIAEVGGDIILTASIESYSENELENVRLTFYLPEYGIQFKSSSTNLKPGQRKTLTVHGFLPYDIRPGIYYPMIGLSDKYIRRMKVGYLEVVEK